MKSFGKKQFLFVLAIIALLATGGAWYYYDQVLPAQADSSAQTIKTTRVRRADLHRQGAVGEMLMRCYDASDCHVPTPLESHIISLDWEDIHRLPYVVATAAGPTKVEVIRGALRGRLCHCLLTDTDTAQRVLRL